MQITPVDVTSCIMAKDDPTWRFALGANPLTEGWIVAITSDDGNTGYGYASATAHIGASYEGIQATLERFKPLLIGKDPFDIELILRELDRNLAGNNQAKAAIDCALYDLMAKSLGVPLYKLFGGKVRDRVPILRILAIKTPAGNGRQRPEAGRQGLPLFQDQGAWRRRRRRGVRQGDPPAGRRRRASDDRRQPVLSAEGRHYRDQPHGRVRHRPGRAAGEGRRHARTEAGDRFGAGDRRGRREPADRSTR